LARGRFEFGAAFVLAGNSNFDRKPNFLQNRKVFGARHRCSVAAFGSGIVVFAAAAVDDIVVVYLEGVVVVVAAVVAVEGVAAFERW